MNKAAVFSCLLAVCILCGMNVLWAQAETAAYKKNAELFLANYNSGAYEEIFNSFSPEMQNALPLEKTTEFLSGLKTQAGVIQSMEFVRYKMTYGVYKTIFLQMTLTVYISTDDAGKINGLFVDAWVPDIPTPERTVTKMRLPFKDEWYVFWGGDTSKQNYHVDYKPYKNAFDFVMHGADGKSFKTDGKTNDDYYAFGKKLYAPCDGTVVLAVDGVKDNIPKEMDPYIPLGNCVIIKTDANEYIVFAHFKQNTVSVHQGQRIHAGSYLGRCGNSGNSSEPHLHFHVQNTEKLYNATGIKCFFETVIVNGEKKTDHSPVQGELVRMK